MFPVILIFPLNITLESIFKTFSFLYVFVCCGRERKYKCYGHHNESKYNICLSSFEIGEHVSLGLSCNNFSFFIDQHFSISRGIQVSGFLIFCISSCSCLLLSVIEIDAIHFAMFMKFWNKPKLPKRFYNDFRVFSTLWIVPEITNWFRLQTLSV